MKLAKKQIVSLLSVMVVIFCFAAPVSALNIASPSGIVVDAKDGGPLYAKDADTLRTPASTTKLMTLQLVFEALNKGTINYDTVIPISQNVHNISMRADWSNVPLYVGHTYTVNDLLDSVLVVSANGSACAFAEYLGGSEANFVNMMNQKAAELGLNATFADCTGLSANTLISCRSLAKLSITLINTYPDVLKYSAKTSISFEGRTYSATNKMLPGGAYAFPGMDGLKTGSTTPAGACFVGTAYRNGTRVIAVLLKSRTASQRYTDATAMLNYGFEQAPFFPLKYKDVPNNEWYFDAVKTGTERGLVNGESEYAFNPDGKVNRAMFVTVIGRLWESKNGVLPEVNTGFADVEKASYYEKYVAWAHEKEIVKGYDETHFGPNDTITREDMVTILFRYATLVQGEITVDLTCLSKFVDANTLGEYALNATAWAVQNGIIKGVDETHIGAKESANRAQMIQILVRY
ncbi:MAG: S-layer homology domain-containing protein [Clostridiales bacterium]